MPYASTPDSPGSTEWFLGLRGQVIHSSDRRPAAGAALVFHFDEEYQEAVTDSDGRFETLVPRGGVAVRVWHRGMVPDPDWAEHLEVEPGTFLLSDPLPGEVQEIQLVLVDPAAWLEVEVVTANGAPSEAVLRWDFRPPPGAGVALGGGRSSTDVAGRARLPFPSVVPGARMFLVAVLRQDVISPVRQHVALVSERVTVQPPLPEEPVRLVLDEGGSVRVRAVDARGEPVNGAEIRLQDEDRTLQLGEEEKATDATGTATFTAIGPGRYRVSFWNEPTSDWVMAEVEAGRGRTEEVELRAPDMPTAVAGRVVDSSGQPLGRVSVVVSIGESSTTTSTDTQGVFSVGSAERGRVHVSAEADLWTDRFEPAELDVPFGTHDVLIRQLESRKTTSLALEILERTTLERIPDAMVLGFVEPHRSSWSFHRARAGLVALELKLYDDVGLAVEAVGYRRRLLLASELARDVPAGETCKVLLEPGLERWLQVLDEESGEPLLAAQILDGGRLVATTDGDGRALIDLPGWPVELVICATGHVDAVWNCRDWLSELEDGFVFLARAAESAPASEAR